MMSVNVIEAPEFSASAPRELFRFDGSRQYDVAPDGRFLTVRNAAAEEHPSEVVLVEGWFEKLERLVPRDR